MFVSTPRRTALLLAGVAAAALAAPLAAQAQTATALPTIHADAASPAPSHGLDRLIAGEVHARRHASADTLSLVAGEPGLALQANGGISSLPVVRGLGESRVLVTIDGETITVFCPNGMNPPGSYVSPSRVTSIALLPTLSPVSAGGDNIAGVVAVTTAPPTFAGAAGGLERSGEASLSYHSVADALGASGRVAVAGERFAVSYDASWNRAENYRAGDGRRVRSTLFEAYDQAITFAALAGPGVLTLQAGRHFAPYEGFPAQRMDLTENDSTFANLRYEGTFAWGELTARASWRSVEHEMNFLEDKGGAATGGMPMNTEGRDLSAAVSASRFLSDGGVLRGGVEAYRTEVDDWWPAVPGSMMMGPLDYWNITDGRRERLGVWGEWEARPSAQWTTLVGVRFEQVETDAGPVQPYSWTGMMNAADAAAALAFNARDRRRRDDNVDLTARATWRPSETATLEFGYARKTRTPNLYERYAWGVGAMSSSMTSFAGDANGYVGDPDLRPEVAHHLAATLSLTNTAQTRGLTFGVYRSQVDDFIDAVKLGDLSRGFVKLRFANVDARLHGFDASGHAQLWNSDSMGVGTLSGTLSWVEGENLDSGDNLYHMAPLTGRVALHHRQGPWSTVAEVELVGEKSQVNALRKEPETGAYALFNLRTSWTHRALRVDLAAENLFDTAYDLPLGGVSYGDFRAEGFATPIQPLPGPGRSINLALTVSF